MKCSFSLIGEKNESGFCLWTIKIVGMRRNQAATECRIIVDHSKRNRGISGKILLKLRFTLCYIKSIFETVSWMICVKGCAVKYYGTGTGSASDPADP